MRWPGATTRPVSRSTRSMACQMQGHNEIGTLSLASDTGTPAASSEPIGQSVSSRAGPSFAAISAAFFQI